MPKPNPEAVLAVKLFQAAQRRKPGYQDHINEIYACADAARLMALARSFRRLDIAAFNGRDMTAKEVNRKIGMLDATSEILAGYGLRFNRSYSKRNSLVIHFPGGEAGWGI